MNLMNRATNAHSFLVMTTPIPTGDDLYDIEPMAAVKRAPGW